MGKQYGNPDVNAPRNNQDHPQSSPSTINAPPTTSSFPSGVATHVHRSPLGENNQRADKPYSADGNKAMKCQFGSHAPFKEERSYRRDYEAYASAHDGPYLGGKKSWNSRTGKSTERGGSDSFATDDDDSFSRRYGGSGLGKSG